MNLQPTPQGMLTSITWMLAADRLTAREVCRSYGENIFSAAEIFRTGVIGRYHEGPALKDNL